MSRILQSKQLVVCLDIAYTYWSGRLLNVKSPGAYTERNVWPNLPKHAIILNHLNCAQIPTGGLPASEGAEAIRGAGERNQTVPKANGKTGKGGRAEPGTEKLIMPKSLSSYFFIQIELP